MTKFVLSKHAKERILHGGDDGELRTHLSTEEVLGYIAEGEILSLDDGVYLFSEVDNKTLYLPTVEVGDNEFLVKTVFPAGFRRTWPGFLARFRKIGRSFLFFSDNIPERIQKNMVMVVLVHCDEQSEKLRPLIPMFSWFSERRDFMTMLKDIMFHHHAVEFVDSWIETEEQVVDLNDIDICVGYLTADKKVHGMRFPLCLPYEVSGLPAPPSLKKII